MSTLLDKTVISGQVAEALFAQQIIKQGGKLNFICSAFEVFQQSLNLTTVSYLKVVHC